MLYLIFKILLTVPVLILTRARVHGWKQLFRKGPLIIVSNHLTVMDPFFLAMVMPRRIRFMAKKELFEKPFISHILQDQLLCFPVDRDGMGLDSLKKALAVLSKGQVFGIFPEGRRSVTGSLDQPEKGAAFLALRSGAPIIPIWAEPTGYRRFRIHMRVGEPIDAKAVAARYAGKPADVVTREIANAFIRLAIEMENE